MTSCGCHCLGMTVDGSGARPRLTEQVAEEIRALLARRRISGRELARRMDASHSWVNFRLTGAQPITLDDLQRFADVLDVDVLDLLPRATEGRLITTSGATNQRSGHAAGRLRHGSSRTITKRPLPHAHPVGRPEAGTAVSTPTGPPTQRRPGLITHRPGN